MKRKSKFSRALVAFAILLGWRAQAELRELSKDQLKQAQIPRDTVGKLLTAQILLSGDNGQLCFDNGQAFDKAHGDAELLNYVEVLRQLTIGSTVVKSCKPGMMPMGSQDIYPW